MSVEWKILQKEDSAWRASLRHSFIQYLFMDSVLGTFLVAWEQHK